MLKVVRKVLVNDRYVFAEFEEFIRGRNNSFVEIIDVKNKTVMIIYRNTGKKLLINYKDISEKEIEHIYLRDSILKKVTVRYDKTFVSNLVDVEVIFYTQKYTIVDGKWIW